MEDCSSILQVECELGMSCTNRQTTCKKIHRSELGEKTLASNTGSNHDPQVTIIIPKNSDEEAKVPQTSKLDESLNDCKAANKEDIINFKGCPLDNNCNQPFCESTH